MIADEQVAQIRHLFHAEHWKIGTIAAELHLHPETVRAALDTDRFRTQRAANNTGKLAAMCLVGNCTALAADVGISN